ncbi:MAG TPA: hypothetical protein PLX17_00565 [Chitinophagaceae bacterium]|nr:hypothetical protein [Chitinophagaceae bacterium]
MKNELAVLTTNDLQAAGINYQLTSNDLVEVVAHDIYDKYVDAINKTISNGKILQKKYYDILNPEINKMKSTLSKHFKDDGEVEIGEDDDYIGEEFEGIIASFSSADIYWPSVSLSEISIKEKDKGSFIESSNRNLSFPQMKDKTAKVVIKLTSGKKNNTEEIKIGGISGKIDTTIQKTFSQTITLPMARFQKLANEFKCYNKEVSALLDFLPKNGALSVERFTREARVKMNKKIISAQSPDFRKKISELFNINL